MEGEPGDSGLDEIDYSSASEGEEEGEEEDRPVIRRAAEYPTAEIIPLALRNSVPEGSKPRLLSPFLSRFELSALLEARKKELDEMPREEIEEKVGVPGAVLTKMAQRNRLETIKHLRERLRYLKAQRRSGFAALSLPKRRPPQLSRVSAEEEEELNAVENALNHIESETSGETRLFEAYLDTYQLAEEEWNHRREANPKTGGMYGPPYFLARKRPDGKTELWLISELELRK